MKDQVSPAAVTPADALARIDAVRERIRRRLAGGFVLAPGETWRDLASTALAAVLPDEDSSFARAAVAAGLEDNLLVP